MLGKLLKNEIKHSGRYIMLIYIAVAVMVGLLGLSMISSATWLGAICCTGLYVVGFACFIVTVVSVIRNFYDTLFGRQGYLTLALPVKSSTLLISKVIVSFMWIVTGFIVMILTYLVIFFYARGKSQSMIQILLDTLAVSGASEFLPSKGVIIQILLAVCIVVLLTIFSYVALVLFSVTAVNIRPLQSHPKLYGGILFFTCFAVINSLGNVFTRYFPLTINITTEKLFFSLAKMGDIHDVIFSYGLGGTIFSALAGVILLVVTGWLLEHKVNLK